MVMIGRAILVPGKNGLEKPTVSKGKSRGLARGLSKALEGGLLLLGCCKERENVKTIFLWLLGRE